MVKVLAKSLDGWSESVKDYEVLRRELPNYNHKAESLFRAQVALKKSIIKEEKNLLAEVDTNCIVKIYCYFENNEYLCLIIEYLPGGDMRTLVCSYVLLFLLKYAFNVLNTE